MATESFVFAHVRSSEPPAWEQWLVRHKRAFIAVGAVLIGLSVMSVVWQVLYPTNRALPLMSIGGIDVSNKDSQTITQQLADYAQKGELTVASPNKRWQEKWQTIGISVDPEASLQAALSYEQWERFIPFSSIIRTAQSRQLPLVAVFDADRLKSFATRIVAEDKLAASDASLHITDGKVVVDQAKNGYEFTVEDVMAQVRTAKIGANATLTLVPKQIPARPVGDILAAKDAAEIALGHSLTLQVAGKTFSPDATTVGGWLAFATDEKTKKPQLTFNQEAIMAYLMQIDHEVGIEPGNTTVTLLDDQEIARTPAPGGQTVATSANVATLQTALQGSSTKPVVALAIVQTGPRPTYIRTYSQSDAGLLAIIQDWRRAHSGDYAVIVRELGGQNRYAEVNPDKSYVTASTFKLFVYYAVQQRIQAGTLGYQSSTDMGWTVEDCLEEMIVRSTNPCAISLLNLVGWQTTEDIAHQAGFTSTFLNNYSGGDKYSTIRDETNYMMRLYYGTLMGPEATDRLLGYLKRQIWRGGIPSGVPAGTVVADKVGLYDGWVHDVGIIYGPKSTFMVGIFSHYGSDPAFADLAGRMYTFFKN